MHPVTHEEVTEAAASLRNYHAPGSDGVPNKLVKYACQIEDTAKWVAHLEKSAIKGNFHLALLGDGLLIPIQKAGKPRGPVGNLRTIVLLNGIRNILSLILLERFRDHTDSFIPASQAGFRKGRGCTDIIFAKRIICSLAQLTSLEAHFLCLDLSKAFDTPSRRLILDSLNQASKGDQDISQISHTLLSGTTLRV